MKKHLFAAFAAALLLASCTKDSGTPPASLVGKWQLDNYTVHYLRAGRTDSFATITRDSLKPCEQDDYRQYNADTTGAAYYGIKCAGDSVTQEAFGWNLSGNFLIITYANGQQEGMTISSISNDYYTAFDTLYPTANRPDTATLLQQYKRVQ